MACKKGRRHITAKYATTWYWLAVLPDYVPTNTNRLYSIDSPNLTWKYLTHFVIINRSRFISLLVTAVTIHLGEHGKKRKKKKKLTL